MKKCVDIEIQIEQQKHRDFIDGDAREAFLAGYELAHGFILTARERGVIGGKYFKIYRASVQTSQKS